MANDRIFFKCKHCGETQTLAKYYPTIGHGVWFPESVSDWVGKHMECSPAFGGMDLEGDRCFDLFAESVVDKQLNPQGCNISLPKITPEMVEDYYPWLIYDDPVYGHSWNQAAVDFACLVKSECCGKGLGEH